MREKRPTQKEHVLAWYYEYTIAIFLVNQRGTHNEMVAPREDFVQTVEPIHALVYHKTHRTGSVCTQLSLPWRNQLAGISSHGPEI